jgi:hypothetical protein
MNPGVNYGFERGLTAPIYFYRINQFIKASYLDPVGLNAQEVLLLHQRAQRDREFELQTTRINPVRVKSIR